ncbi:MAG: PKD domain-containing protein, partial [Candidatus Thermoplasmatota archaeon]
DGVEINVPNLTATDTCIVTVVSNLLPVADAGPDREIRYDRWLQFNGAGSYDKDGYIVSYYWDFGDGQFSYEVTPLHIYDLPGIYIVNLTVTDNEGATGCDTCIVRVTGNENPIANAGPDRIAYVNQEITFDGSASYDPDGYIVSYIWDFGDGTTATGISATHAYSIGNKMYYVRLTVTDNDGGTGNDVCIVTVITNLGPQASIFVSLYPFYQVTLRYKPVTLYASAWDPDGYIEKYRWDFHDGTPTDWIYVSGQQSSISIKTTHAFAGSKDYDVEYTITFVAVDNMGAEVKADAWVYVLKNVAPFVYAGGNQAKYVNTAINSSWNTTVEFVFLALDLDGNLTNFEIDLGDGTIESFDATGARALTEEEAAALLEIFNYTMLPPALPFESLLRESRWLVVESLTYVFRGCLMNTLKGAIPPRTRGIVITIIVGIAGLLLTIWGAKKIVDQAYESGKRCNVQK